MLNQDNGIYPYQKQGVWDLVPRLREDGLGPALCKKNVQVVGKSIQVGGKRTGGVNERALGEQLGEVWAEANSEHFNVWIKSKMPFMMVGKSIGIGSMSAQQGDAGG